MTGRREGLAIQGQVWLGSPRAVRSLCWALLAAWGCASGGEPDADRPFIKLADRKMGLFLYWRGAPEVGFAEAVHRKLLKRIGAAYHVRLAERRVMGAYSAIEPPILRRLALAGIDDVVIVELRRKERGVAARVVVQPLSMPAPLIALSVPPIVGRDGGQPDAKRIADFVTLRLTRHWTDPAAAPQLNLLRVADQLAEREACAEAAELYDLGFGSAGVAVVTDLESEVRSRSLQTRCEEVVADQDAIERDMRESFEVVGDTEGMGRRFEHALAKAIAKTKKPLKALTDKRVRVEVRPGQITFDVRYQPERYRAKTASLPRYDGEYLLVHLDAFLPFMRIQNQMKQALIRALPPYDRPTVEKYALTLHLRKLDESVDLDFAVRGDDLILSDSLRFRSRRTKGIEVRSLRDRASATKRLMLGPPRDEAGKLTEYGLVAEFFELDL